MKDFIKPLIITLPIYVILFFLIFGKNDKFSPKDLMKELNQRDSIISKRIDKILVCTEKYMSINYLVEESIKNS